MVAVQPSPQIDDFVRLLFRIASRVHRPGDFLEPDELVGEAVQEVKAACKRYDPDRGLRPTTYIGAVARWAMRRARSRWNGKILVPLPQDDEGRDMEPVAPFEAEPVETDDLVGQALGVLSPRQREVVAGYYGLTGESVSLTDLASRSGSTPQAVSAVHMRALAKMRAKVMPKALC
jgi:RNA polymerase sigma factor (sigma-70 family)